MAHGYRELADRFSQHDIVIYGMNDKGAQVNKEWVEKENLPFKGQKARNYFCTSKNHQKSRAKRKKDREKEVSTLGSVLEACINGKTGDISRNLLKKGELRSVHSVEGLLIRGFIGACNLQFS